MTKLNLPDPNHGRYWQIGGAEEHDFYLILRAPDDTLLRQSHIYVDTTKDSLGITELAEEILAEQFIADNYVGTIKFNKET